MTKKQSPRQPGKAGQGAINKHLEGHHITAAVEVQDLRCQKCGYFRHTPRPIRARAFCMFTGEALREREMAGCPFWTPKEVAHD
jgi:hypothetical protein